MPRRVTPITDAIAPSKQDARRHYGSHPYFTKRAWNVVQAYIERFSEPGDIVLDPFGGSGVTAVESLVLRRRAVYVDISEWARFLARQTAIAPVDIGRLQAAFGDVEDQNRAWIEELEAKDQRSLAHQRIKDWYPRDVRLPSNADVELVEQLFTPRMLHGLARLRAAIEDVPDQASRDLLLLAFSATIVRINKTFLSASDRAESRGGSAIFSIYRYKVAKKVVELPLWTQFARRVERLIAAKRETNALIGEFYREVETARFIHGSATRLDEHLKPESVDYIYTDPPYGGHISYLDLSTMWAAWLKLNISARDRAEEVIEGGELRKSVSVYHHLMSTSLDQMSAVLRHRGWLSLVFAHRDASYWEALVDASAAAGFEYVNTVVQPVGVIWSMHKKKNPLKVLSGELVLNFRRQSPRRRRTPLRDLSAETLVIETCRRAIVSKVGCTTEELCHAIVPSLLEAGALSEFTGVARDLPSFLARHFEFEPFSSRWHLRPGDAHLKMTDETHVAYLVTRVLRDASAKNLRLTANQVVAAISRHAPGKHRAIPHAVLRTLRRVAYCVDGERWTLSNGDRQQEFAFGT